LDILLLKIHEALPSLEHEYALPRFSLTQNPQFFQKFPYEPSDFPETKDDFKTSIAPIYPLHFWNSVVTVNKPDIPIDLIVDRSESLSEKETAVFKKEAQRITQEYRNIWPLDNPSNSDDKPSFAARGFYLTL
jgi:hypothetical protein